MNDLLLVDNGYIGQVNKKYKIPSHTYFFVEDISRDDINVCIFQFFKQIPCDENILGSEITSEIISSEFKDKNFFSKIISYVLIFKKLRNNINRFDFVYVFYPGHLNYLVLIYCLLIKKDYGLYVRGEFNRFLPFTKAIIKKANVLITNNPIDKTKLSKINDRCKMIISYNKLGNVLPKLKNVPISNKKQNDYIDILFVGRVEFRKGIIDLIDAFSMLDPNINFRLTVVGGGNLLDECNNKIIQDEFLKDRITLLGNIDDENEISKFYHRADMFVLPTYTEGFPRVLFDCMINKVPILTTMVGGIPGFLKDKVNCIELKINNPSDIKEKIMYAINDRSMMKDMADNAYTTLSNYLKDDVVLHKDIIIKYFNQM